MSDWLAHLRRLSRCLPAARVRHCGSKNQHRTGAKFLCEQLVPFLLMMLRRDLMAADCAVPSLGGCFMLIRDRISNPPPSKRRQPTAACNDIWYHTYRGIEPPQRTVTLQGCDCTCPRNCRAITCRGAPDQRRRSRWAIIFQH